MEILDTTTNFQCNNQKKNIKNKLFKLENIFENMYRDIIKEYIDDIDKSQILDNLNQFGKEKFVTFMKKNCEIYVKLEENYKNKDYKDCDDYDIKY